MNEKRRLEQKKFDFGDALFSLYPNKQWILRGTDSLAGLEWNEPNIPKPTEAELLAEKLRLQAEYDARAYQRLRVTEYPDIEAQLDMLYWDKVNGTNIWVETIQNIKNKYSKPENS